MRHWTGKLREKFKRFFWHGYWTDPVIFFSLVLAVIANAAIWAALYFTVEATDRPIILHYNIYFGVDSIGDWRNVYVMPALALVIFFINLFLSRFFYYKERLASHLFAAMAFLVQLLMAIGVASIILINF
ncbi:MAG: hypothetical protein WC831_05925 [Parcubacteria group bacterium]|jgi:hypothetical protein